MSRKRCFEEAFNLMCGDLIGEGVHRKVFSCKIRDDLVVKVEEDVHRNFANIHEMDFWQENQFYEPVARWLAPAVFMSPEGRILMQKRCERLPSSYPLPERLPTFLTDVKTDNYGLFEGRLVCMDYASTIANASTRLRKVEWMVGC